MRKFPLAAAALLSSLLGQPAQAQFDAYTWEFQDGAWGGGQSFISGDQLLVELNPDCSFGILDEGWAVTTMPRTGRITLDYDANSVACPAFGGFCNEAQLVAALGPDDCSIYPLQGLPTCDYTLAEFNGGSPYFGFEGPMFLAGSWSFDVTEGDRLKLGASTQAFSEDCRILATFSNLAFQPAMASTGSEISLASGGVVGLTLTAPQPLAGMPYLVLGSASGTQPGIAVDGWTVPLLVDGYFWLTLTSPAATPLASGIGVLDGLAQANIDFELAPAAPAALAGLELFHAGVVFRPTGAAVEVAFATPAVSLELVP